MTASPATEPYVWDPALIADPYAGYSRIREEAPVLLGKRMDGGKAWYVTRFDDVRTVLSDVRFVNNVGSVPGGMPKNPREKIMEMLGIPEELLPYLLDSILDADGVDHTRLRKLVSRAFTVKRVNALRPRVEEIASGLLDGLTDPADIVADYAYPLPITVICELVGVPVEDRPAWRRWGAALLTFQTGNSGPALQEMIAYCHDLVAKRRAEPRDDLVTDLVRAQDDDGDQLSDAEMVTMILTLVLAGHETTAHLISNATRVLITHPDQLTLLQRDPGLWPGAVHELMRFCGPVQIPRLRYAAQDVELGGVSIRTGDAVQAVLVSANYDPREYADPERLDVTRRPTGRGDGHVGFGHGLHYCLGAALARQEGEVALRRLFERFPHLALVEDEPEWVTLPGMRRLARLPVHLAA